MKFQATNPATGEVVADYPAYSRDRISEIVARAGHASVLWKNAPIADRGQFLTAAAHALRARQRLFADLITAEMGKPIRQASAEIEKCAAGCEFYARHAEEFLTPRPIASDAARSYVRYDPLGAVLAIMPWNFPFWQVFRCAAPALMAGNVVLLKHASNVPGCAMAIEELLLQAGLPEGVFSTLLISADQAAEIVADDLVAAVSLTGSDAAGETVAAAAGKQLKKCVLELGGSDPFIVLADADVANAARQAVAARCQNTGQSCIAAKRFIVETPIADEFTAEMITHMERLKVGDPTEAATDVGPLARGDLREDLHAQVTASIASGARLRIGGQIPTGPGWFYPPTLLEGVECDMPVFADETFGPVAAVVVARDAEDAVEIANDSRYGLGASIWTRNAQRGEELAARIDAGNVFVNEIVKSDPRVPFGGVKRSGYGRELSDYGVREFVNVKTVWIR